MTKTRIAIFDLDETLTRKGTWGRFVTGTIKGQPLKWIPFLVSSISQQLLYMAGQGPREHVKEKMMRWTISGKTRQELTELAEAFAENEVENGLRAKSLDMIENHRRQGDRVMIASAAVDLICEPVAKRLGVTDVVCTKTQFTKDDRLDTKLGGRNCYGLGKLRLVKQYLDDIPGYNRAKTHITMYTDSRSDLAILEWADVGIAVNPSPRLRKVAEKRGFEIQDWDETKGQTQ